MQRGFAFFMVLAMLALVCPAPAFAHGVEDKEPKKGILLVAFGTSVPEAEKAVNALVSATKSAFPDTEVRLSYTSNIIRKKLKKERNSDIPTPPEALAKMNDDGFTHVCVQPMHVIPGEEYDSLKSAVLAFASIQGKYGFERLLLGRPFLTDAKDLEIMAEILTRRFKKSAETDQAVVLMGHGTHHQANALYLALQEALSKGSDHFFVGTVEAPPTFDDILAALKKTRYRNLLLTPFMIVAGDHAINDLAAANDPESWYSRFKEAGFNVETDLRGLGEYPEIAELFLKRVLSLMKDLEAGKSE